MFLPLSVYLGGGGSECEITKEQPPSWFPVREVVTSAPTGLLTAREVPHSQASSPVRRLSLTQLAELSNPLVRWPLVYRLGISGWERTPGFVHCHMGCTARSRIGVSDCLSPALSSALIR